MIVKFEEPSVICHGVFYVGYIEFEEYLNCVSGDSK